MSTAEALASKQTSDSKIKQMFLLGINITKNLVHVLARALSNVRNLEVSALFPRTLQQ